jgi:hypothetical protein
MPTVPEYKGGGAIPDAGGGTRLTTPDRMMQASVLPGQQEERLGAGLLSAGREMTAEATMQQIQWNEVQGKNADSSVVAGIDAIMHGAQTKDGVADPTQGYLNQHGDDAVQKKDATVKALQDLKTQALDALDNPAQKQLVAKTLDMRLNAALSQTADHYNHQTSVAEQAAGTTRQNTASEAAAKNFNILTDNPAYSYDPKDPSTQSSSYQQYLHTVAIEAQAAAGRAGYHNTVDKDGNEVKNPVVADAVREALQGTYVKAIGSMISSGATGPAQAYFDKVKDQLDVKSTDRILAVLEPVKTADKALAYSDELFANVAGEKAQMARVQEDFAAKKITGQQRMMIESRIEHRAAKARSDDDRYTATAVGQAQNYFINNPHASILDLKAASPQLYVSLERKGHLDSAVAFSKRAANEPSNPVVLSDMYANLGKGTPLDIVGMSDTEWQGMRRAGINDSDWSKYDGLRSDYKSGKYSVEIDVAKKVQTVIHETSAGLQAAGLANTGKLSTDKAAALAEFKVQLGSTLEEAYKKNPNLTDVQAGDIARGLVKTQALAGTGVFGLFQTKVPAWKMTDTQRQANWEVPDAERAKIVADLAAAGRKADDATVQRLYKMKMGVGY